MWNESHIMTMQCDQCGEEISQNKMEIKFGGGPFGQGWYTIKKIVSHLIPVGIHDKKSKTEWHFCSMGCLSNWAVDNA